MEGQRQDMTPQAVINITEDAVWNLMSACSNTGLPQPVIYLPLRKGGVQPLQDFARCLLLLHACFALKTHSARKLETKGIRSCWSGDVEPEAVHSHHGCPHNRLACQVLLVDVHCASWQFAPLGLWSVLSPPAKQI